MTVIKNAGREVSLDLVRGCIFVCSRMCVPDLVHCHQGTQIEPAVARTGYKVGPGVSLVNMAFMFIWISPL